MYGRCSLFFDAYHLFDIMPHRNIYSWVGIIIASVKHGFNEKALLMFQELLYVEKVVSKLEFFLFPVVLNAYGGFGFIEPGRELHGCLLKTRFLSNVYVSNALIDMYGKCGAMDEALKVFDGMEERDCVSWNSVITGCASSGMPFESLRFLESMQLCNDTKPSSSWEQSAPFRRRTISTQAINNLLHLQDKGPQSSFISSKTSHSFPFPSSQPTTLLAHH